MYDILIQFIAVVHWNRRALRKFAVETFLISSIIVLHLDCLKIETTGKLQIMCGDHKQEKVSAIWERNVNGFRLNTSLSVPFNLVSIEPTTSTSQMWSMAAQCSLLSLQPAALPATLMGTWIWFACVLLSPLICRWSSLYFIMAGFAIMLNLRNVPVCWSQ